MKAMKIAVLCVLLATLTGCAYLSDRGRDFADCWRFSVGIGPEVMIHAKAAVIGAGGGYGEITRVGVEHKNFSGVWEEEGFGVPGVAYLRRSCQDVEGNNGDASRKGWGATVIFFLFATEGKDIKGREGELSDKAEDYCWTEAEVSLGVSMRVGFNLAEFADFLLGWGTLDILYDDKGSQPPIDIPLPNTPRKSR